MSSNNKNRNTKQKYNVLKKRNYDATKFNRSRYHNKYQKTKNSSFKPASERHKASISTGKWTKRGMHFNVKIDGTIVGNLLEKKNKLKWIPYKKINVRS